MKRTWLLPMLLGVLATAAFAEPSPSWPELEARKEREALRNRKLDQLSAELQAKATQDWSHIEPLLDSRTQSTEHVVRAYVDTYEGAKVRFDEVERAVSIPEVAQAKASTLARAWIGASARPSRAWSFRPGTATRT